MKNYKIILFTGISFIVLLVLFTSCGCNNGSESDTEKNDNSKIDYGKSMSIKDTTKILTYGTDTYVSTCEICKKNITDSGWKTILIEPSSDFFTRIRTNADTKITELDIVTHSVPGKFGNYFNMNDICTFADRLKEYIDTNTVIYLNGCNTGVENYSYDVCIRMSSAQRLANLTGCTVYGAKGFLDGSYAEHNEKCHACEGDYCVGADATGPQSWQVCTPSTDNCTCIYIIKKESTLYERFMEMAQTKSNLVSEYKHSIRPFPDLQFILNVNNFTTLRYSAYILEGLLYDQTNHSIYSFTNKQFRTLTDSLSFFSNMK